MFTAKGGCFHKVTIYLPQSAKNISVYNGNDHINGAVKKLSTSQFIELLDDLSFSSEKQDALKDFSSTLSTANTISIDELEDILDELSFDSDQLTAVKLLAKHIPKSNRIDLLELIEDELSGSHERKAKEIILNL